MSLSVSCTNVKTNDSIISDETNEIITADDFFPKLSIADYYDYVEFDNNAQPLIGDKLIMKVIEDVISRVASSKGTIKFSITRYTNSSVDFNFEWTYLDMKLYKIYSFEIRI